MLSPWCLEYTVFLLLASRIAVFRLKPTLNQKITQGGEGRGEKIRRGKLRKAKAEALKRGLVARSCARSGRKDVVGEVKGIEMMGVLIAGRGARERGSRRLQVEVHSKR